MVSIINTFVIVLLAIVGHAKATITLFEHSNYYGMAHVINSTTEFIGNEFNDYTTSFKVSPGETWILFDDRGFSGKSIVARGENPYVGKAFNDKVSSLEKFY